MCPSARSCNTPAGCSYTTPQSFNRDDLAATGFVPKDFRPPLKVLFKNISGAGIDTDPITGICPPTTRAQADLVENFNKTMSFKPDLFLVLTQQQTLRSPAASGCDSDTSTSCSTTCWIAHSTCVNGACMCQQGYCWNGKLLFSRWLYGQFKLSASRMVFCPSCAVHPVSLAIARCKL